MEEPTYLSTHAPPAALAPAGHVVVQVARYLHPDDHFDRHESESALWVHAERAGIRRVDVVASRYLHEMTVSGGMPLAASGGLSGRPGVGAWERPGAFLAGDWVGGEGMLADAAAASGTAAGRAAARWAVQQRSAA